MIVTRMAALLLLAAGSAGVGGVDQPGGPTWTNVVIETIDFRQEYLTNALQFVQDEVNRADTSACFTVRYDFRGPDRRWTAPASSPLDELVTFRARDLSAGEALKIIANVCGLDHAVGKSDVTLTFPARGVLFVPPNGGWRPGVYREFDRFVTVPPRDVSTVRRILACVAEATGTDIQFDPKLNAIAERTGLDFAQPDYRAVELVKTCVMALEKAAGKRLCLAVPNGESAHGGWLDETGRALSIGFQQNPPDARMLLRQLGRDEPDDFQEAITRFKAMTFVESVYFEPELNVLWIIGQNQSWWAGMDYWRFVGESDRRYHVVVERDASVTLTPTESDVMPTSMQQ